MAGGVVVGEGIAAEVTGRVALAQGCPLLTEGGGVEIGELTPVPGRHHPARDF